MLDLNNLDGKELYKYYYTYKENKFDIVDDIPKTTKNILFYRYVKLTNNQFKNIQFNYNINKQEFYFIIYDNIEEETNIHSLIFGREIYNIMEYQNLDEFKRFLKNENNKNEDIENIKKNYSKLRELIEEFNLQDNVYIFSSFILTILGTTYTKDIDCFLFDVDVKDINKILTKSDKDLDLSIFNSNTKYYEKKDGLNKYGKLIYTYRFANEYFNEPDIFHVINDFNYIFIFDGIKYFGLNFFIRRALSRTHYKSYTDLIGLKIKNNYPLENYKDYFCISNFKNRQEKLIYVFNERYLNTVFYPSIIKYLKLWYNVDYKTNEIKQLIPVCRDTKSIYTRPNIIKISESTRNIVVFNNIYKINILKKYSLKDNKRFNVLDIGAGKFNDYFKFWRKTNSLYVGLEPSIDSLNIAKMRLNDDDKKNDKRNDDKKNDNVKFVHGFGDENWDKYNDILDYKYDIIVFSFTIHYMIIKQFKESYKRKHNNFNILFRW